MVLQKMWRSRLFWDLIIWYHCIKYGFPIYCKFKWIALSCYSQPGWAFSAFSEDLLNHPLINVFISSCACHAHFYTYPLSHKSHRDFCIAFIFWLYIVCALSLKYDNDLYTWSESHRQELFMQCTHEQPLWPTVYATVLVFDSFRKGCLVEI